MAQCYGIILWFQGLECWLSIPAAQTFPEQSEANALLKASKVIGSVEQGDGDAQPSMVPKRDHGG